MSIVTTSEANVGAPGHNVAAVREALAPPGLAPLKAPFPWFGGKRRAAHLVWPRVGDVPNYVEPFAGSLAVLLARPHAPGNEIVNDLDCYVANAWRAMKHAADEVAAHCDWPVNEADLHARHRWLHGRAEFRTRMENDPEHFDTRIAAWWIWGLSCWIGDAFCRTKCGSIPSLAGGTGVVRKLPAVAGTYGAVTSHRRGAGGRGVHGARKAVAATERKRPCLDSQRGAMRHQGDALGEWFARLAERLRFTKVCCGDWSRVCTKAATWGQGLTGVLLDPPYSREERDANLYAHEEDGLAARVREWALANGDNPRLRIALCGYEGEHAMPAAWECVAWKAAGGYANRNPANRNAQRERIWFSPHCLRPERELGLFGLAEEQP